MKRAKISRTQVDKVYRKLLHLRDTDLWAFHDYIYILTRPDMRGACAMIGEWLGCEPDWWVIREAILTQPKSSFQRTKPKSK